jgi:hypothetical protein
LKDFISLNVADPVNIRRLAEDFLSMVKDLHQRQISHGDLQHGNIRVGTDGKIGLIDYDSIYVPNLASETDDMKGLPGYQHPARDNLIKLSPKADYFSELIIYLSLLAISEKPSYWKHIEKEERFLFSQDDFINPISSSVFSELKKLSPKIQYLVTELEKFCMETDVERLEPLEHCVNTYTGTRKDWDLSSSSTPIVISSSKISVLNFSLLDSNNIVTNTSSAQSLSNLSATSSTGKSSWDKLSATSSTGKSSWDKLGATSSTGKSSWDKLGATSSTGKSS